MTTIDDLPSGTSTTAVELLSKVTLDIHEGDFGIALTCSLDEGTLPVTIALVDATGSFHAAHFNGSWPRGSKLTASDASAVASMPFRDSLSALTRTLPRGIRIGLLPPTLPDAGLVQDTRPPSPHFARVLTGFRDVTLHQHVFVRRWPFTESDGMSEASMEAADLLGGRWTALVQSRLVPALSRGCLEAARLMCRSQGFGLSTYRMASGDDRRGETLRRFLARHPTFGVLMTEEAGILSSILDGAPDDAVLGAFCRQRGRGLRPSALMKMAQVEVIGENRTSTLDLPAVLPPDWLPTTREQARAALHAVRIGNNVLYGNKGLDPTDIHRGCGGDWLRHLERLKASAGNDGRGLRRNAVEVASQVSYMAASFVTEMAIPLWSLTGRIDALHALEDHVGPSQPTRHRRMTAFGHSALCRGSVLAHMVRRAGEWMSASEDRYLVRLDSPMPKALTFHRGPFPAEAKRSISGVRLSIEGVYRSGHASAAPAWSRRPEQSLDLMEEMLFGRYRNTRISMTFEVPTRLAAEGKVVVEITASSDGLAPVEAIRGFLAEETVDAGDRLLIEIGVGRAFEHAMLPGPEIVREAAMFPSEKAVNGMMAAWSPLLPKRYSGLDREALAEALSRELEACILETTLGARPKREGLMHRAA